MAVGNSAHSHLAFAQEIRLSPSPASSVMLLRTTPARVQRWLAVPAGCSLLRCAGRSEIVIARVAHFLLCCLVTVREHG